MIQKVQYLISNEKNPYINQALEENLMTAVDARTCILLLWQNDNTVFVGKNQNIWQECWVKKLIMDGGSPARRISGGGAVYQDLGNLNFTMLMQGENFNLQKQYDVILEALKRLGVQAKKSGRNDIMADGRKVSGNAYYYSGVRAFHHGTILLNADKEKMEKYLLVSREKLLSKGVDSIKARVANLCELLPDLSLVRLQQSLLHAFEKVYGGRLEEFPIASLDPAQMKNSVEKFSSWDWIYGRKIAFHDGLKRRFPWGSIEISMDVLGGVIERCQVFSDALDAKLPELVMEALRGCQFDGERMECRIRQMGANNPAFGYALEDICGLVGEV